MLRSPQNDVLRDYASEGLKCRAFARHSGYSSFK